MRTYTWAWSDEVATYILDAESLLEIVETIVDYYFGEDDAEEQRYTITAIDGKFLVSINAYEEAYQYEVEAFTGDVIEFLETIAKIQERPDTFAIRTESK